MKTIKFNSFANDKIQEKELNFLLGGRAANDDPLHDLLAPPKRQIEFSERIQIRQKDGLRPQDIQIREVGWVD